MHSDYHICIRGNGEVYFTTDDFTKVLTHTYRRNTNAIGIALCCCYDATINADLSFDLGSAPPTDEQIENSAQIIALIYKYLDIPITINSIMTHAEAADNMDGGTTHEAYGPNSTCEKWDLYMLKDYDGTWKPGGEVLRGKSMWYLYNGF